jgi:hypothetical protein
MFRHWRLFVALLVAGVMLVTVATGCDLENLPFPMP